MMENQFRVRDLRKKEQFIVDDSYLNGYAKLVSPYATLVYLSLCRHADKQQKAFPSIKRMAREFGISAKSVKRGIKELESLNIIKKKRLGKRLSNEYWLLDKSEWKIISQGVKVPTEPSQEGSDGSVREGVMAPGEPNDGSGGTTKDAQGKDSHNKDVSKGLKILKEGLIRSKIIPAPIRTAAQEDVARQGRRKQ